MKKIQSIIIKEKKIKSNETVDIHVFVAYLSAAVTQFGVDLFQKALIVPTWSYKSINWMTFLEIPGNILMKTSFKERSV